MGTWKSTNYMFDKSSLEALQATGPCIPSSGLLFRFLQEDYRLPAGSSRLGDSFGFVLSNEDARALAEKILVSLRENEAA